MMDVPLPAVDLPGVVLHTDELAASTDAETASLDSAAWKLLEQRLLPGECAGTLHVEAGRILHRPAWRARLVAGLSHAAAACTDYWRCTQRQVLSQAVMRLVRPGLRGQHSGCKPASWGRFVAGKTLHAHIPSCLRPEIHHHSSLVRLLTSAILQVVMRLVPPGWRGQYGGCRACRLGPLWWQARRCA